MADNVNEDIKIEEESGMGRGDAKDKEETKEREGTERDRTCKLWQNPGARLTRPAPSFSVCFLPFVPPCLVPVDLRKPD